MYFGVLGYLLVDGHTHANWRMWSHFEDLKGGLKYLTYPYTFQREQVYGKEDNSFAPNCRKKSLTITVFRNTVQEPSQ